MGLISRLFGRRAEPPPPEEHKMEIAPHDAFILRGTRFRKGMWIVYDGHIAILARAFSDATAEVHLVNDEGRTYLIEPYVPLGELRKARLEEIPESRRPTGEHAELWKLKGHYR